MVLWWATCVACWERPTGEHTALTRLTSGTASSCLSCCCCWPPSLPPLQRVPGPERLGSAEACATCSSGRCAVAAHDWMPDISKCALCLCRQLELEASERARFEAQRTEELRLKRERQQRERDEREKAVGGPTLGLVSWGTCVWCTKQNLHHWQQTACQVLLPAHALLSAALRIRS